MIALRIINILLLVLACTQISCCQKQKYHGCLAPGDTTIVLINVAGLSRTEIADLVNYFSDKKINALGIHLIFKGSKENDSVLYNALLKVKNKVVLAAESSDFFSNKSDYPFREFKHGITTYTVFGKGNIIEYYNFNEIVDGESYPSFSYRLLSMSQNNEFGQYHNDSKYYKINYTGNLNCFQNRNHDELAEFNNEFWNGKIVIMGYLGLSDSFDGFSIDEIDSNRTPLSRSKKVYGSVIQANILSSMKSRKE